MRAVASHNVFVRQQHVIIAVDESLEEVVVEYDIRAIMLRVAIAGGDEGAKHTKIEGTR
jgi:hypothetical protein